MIFHSDNTLAVFTPLATDQKIIAERRWRENARPAVPQRPCDAGLFSDNAKQKELFSNGKA